MIADGTRGEGVEQNLRRGREKGRLLVMEFLPRVGHCGGHVLLPQAERPRGIVQSGCSLNTNTTTTNQYGHITIVIE